MQLYAAETEVRKEIFFTTLANPSLKALDYSLYEIVWVFFQEHASVEASRNVFFCAPVYLY